MEPQEYKFSYSIMSNEGSSMIRLFNGTKQPVMFEITTSNLYEYTVSPRTSVIPPESSYDVRFALFDSKSLPTNVKSELKFFVKSKVRIPSGDKAEFPVQELKSGVIYISPGQTRTKPVVEKPASSTSASEITDSNIPKMAAKKLLDIQPSELKFNCEPDDINFNALSEILVLKKEVNCLLQLTNTTDNTVVFKVKTADRNKYCRQPEMGILLPRLTSNVIVRMKAQSEIPSDRQCEDKFLIQSIVVTPSMATRNVTPKMFDEKERCGEESKLGIFYTFPLLISDPQSSSSAISRAHSSSEVKQEMKTKWSSELGNLCIKCIIICLMGLIFWYLLTKIVSDIWSVTIVELVVKTIRNLVWNSVEDWIVKSLSYIFIYFIAIFLGRKVVT